PRQWECDDSARDVALPDRSKQSLDDVDLVKNRQLHGDLRKPVEMAGRDRFALPVLQKQVDYEVPMNAVCREAYEHAQVADSPNNVTKASLHKASRETAAGLG